MLEKILREISKRDVVFILFQELLIWKFVWWGGGYLSAVTLYMGNISEGKTLQILSRKPPVFFFLISRFKNTEGIFYNVQTHNLPSLMSVPSTHPDISACKVSSACWVQFPIELIQFTFAQIPLEKIWIHFVFLQLQVILQVRIGFLVLVGNRTKETIWIQNCQDAEARPTKK